MKWGDSIYCYFCGRPATGTHHLIFGTSQRALCDDDKIFVPVCDQCHTIGKVTSRIHDNIMAEKLSKMLGQALWEKRLIARESTTEEQARERFIKRYGKSYL